MLLPSPTIEQDGRVRARGEFEFFVLQVTPKRVVIAISRLVLNLDSSIHGSVSVCSCPSVCGCVKRYLSFDLNQWRSSVVVRVYGLQIVSKRR